MKIPKEIKRYCPSCKKHATCKVKLAKNRGRNKAHPMTKFSQVRIRLKGRTTGTGNTGRYARGSMNGWKRYNKKHTKKSDFRYTCSLCKKEHTHAGTTNRAKRVIFE